MCLKVVYYCLSNFSMVRKNMNQILSKFTWNYPLFKELDLTIFFTFPIPFTFCIAINNLFASLESSLETETVPM